MPEGKFLFAPLPLHSAIAIAAWLNSQGLHTRNMHKLADPSGQFVAGPRLFTTASIRGILHNPFYAGVVSHRGKLLPGKHEALISQQTFDTVQDLMRKNSGRSTILKAHPARQYLLKGLSRCAWWGMPDWSHTGLANITSSAPAEQLLLARAEMYDLSIRYGIAIDLRDWNHMRACFAPKLAARYGLGMEFTEIEKLVEWLIAPRCHPFTLHMLGNQMVEIDGDSARMETYAKITHEHTDPLMGYEHRDAGREGHYLDRLERINGHWRIAERGLGVASGPVRNPLVATSKDPEVQYLLDRVQI